jgi:Mn2+/Fe2+ NRAMP family transporter
MHNGRILCETVNCFFGQGMVPKSQKRQTLVTMPACKAEPFTLNSRQTYDSMWAIVPGKAHYVTLVPALGVFAGIAFGVGLLASGLSSSTTGTLAGQVVLQGFLGKRVEMWVWRLLTMIPALITIALNVPSLEVLVISQVILSMQLPFTMIAVILLTGRRELMGQFVNGRLTNIVNVLLVLVVTILNVVLLYTVFWG